jgi:hypothetical protein
MATLRTAGHATRCIKGVGVNLAIAVRTVLKTIIKTLEYVTGRAGENRLRPLTLSSLKKGQGRIRKLPLP